MEISVFTIMDYSDSENDISWRTQVPSLENNDPNFNLGEEYYG